VDASGSDDTADGSTDSASVDGGAVDVMVGDDTANCQCTGTGPGLVPVTVDCGQSACGSDYTTYACGSTGWSWTGQACGSAPDAGPCQCRGTGPGLVPVTVDCGQSACGSDYTTYACSSSGWSWTGALCP
jgi:hypothetical protein